MPGARAPRLADIGRAVRAGRRDRGPAEPIPPDEPLAPDPADPDGGQDVTLKAALDETAAEAEAEAIDATAVVPPADDGAAASPTTAASNGVPRVEREPAATRGRR